MKMEKENKVFWFYMFVFDIIWISSFCGYGVYCFDNSSSIFLGFVVGSIVSVFLTLTIVNYFFYQDFYRKNAKGKNSDSKINERRTKTNGIRRAKNS